MLQPNALSEQAQVQWTWKTKNELKIWLKNTALRTL